MMLDPSSTIAVVGASLAGLRAAETLRAEGHTGTIVLIGAEPHFPYDRPPLSKQFLAGTWDLDRVVLRPAEKIASLGLDLRLGHIAGALDVEAHTLELDDGDVVHFDGLVLATGAQPRRLPGAAPLAGVHTLRTLEDSIAIGRSARAEGARVVVVGAGFIGSEVAATCRGLGAHVHGDRGASPASCPCPRCRDGCGVRRVARRPRRRAPHRRGCVRPATGASGPAAPMVRDPGAPVDGVELDDGSVLDADVVVIGIGVVPTTQWLEGSGLLVSDGVVAEATLHAGDVVVVAGDLPAGSTRASGSTSGSSTGPMPPSRAWLRRTTCSLVAPRPSRTSPCRISGRTSTTSRSK